MKRSECTVNKIKADGWITAYRENSNKKFTYEEIVNAIQSGAKTEKEISTLTRTVYIKIDGVVMMFKHASEEEIRIQKEAEEEIWFKKAIEHIREKNMAKIRRRR